MPKVCITLQAYIYLPLVEYIFHASELQVIFIGIGFFCMTALHSCIPARALVRIISTNISRTKSTN